MDAARVGKHHMTPRQQRFVEEYLIDLNATQAAIRAGYSEKTAGQQGFDLLKKPEIQDGIAEAQSERAKRTEIDADWVLRRLGDEASADLADLYDESGALKPVHDWPLIWRQGLVAGMDIEELRVEGETAGTIRKVKLSDRVKRLELLGKHVNVQAFRDQLEQKSQVTVVISKDDADL